MKKPSSGTVKYNAESATLNPYQRLANEIVFQAADDYRAALSWLKRHPTNSGERWRTQAYMAVSCERFFCGEWIQMLTALDGPTIMKRIREEVYGCEKVPDWQMQLRGVNLGVRTMRNFQ